MTRPETIYGDLLGCPFRMGGRDPRTGLDCYGLRREIARRLGGETPEFSYPADGELAPAAIHALVRGGKPSFVALAEPESWCIVTFEIRPGYESHIGTVLPGLRRFVHCSAALGRVVVSDMADVRWRRKTRRYYRER
jgi:hypothetical protein